MNADKFVPQTMQNQIREIDQQLIQLLSKRIATLAKSSPADFTEPNYQEILNRAGVPEFIWQNIVIGCHAILNYQKSPLTHTQPRRVTVIGGKGVMGQFFSQQLFAAGHYVNILDNDDWGQAESLLGAADLVLVCVPIDCTLEVISKAAQYLNPRTALADITSIKAPMIKAMLSHHSGAVMGLHPMFGPGVQSFLSQKIVVCPGRMQEHFQWFLDLLENAGAKLIFSLPEEHDKMMVIVQAIRHFATLSLGVFLSTEKVNIRRSLDLATPIYRQEITIISRLIAQSAQMVVDIMLATPARREAIARLANTTNRLAQLVIQGDREALISEVQGVQSFFAAEAADSFSESTYLINALTTLLAANEAKQANLVSATKTPVQSEKVALNTI